MWEPGAPGPDLQHPAEGGELHQEQPGGRGGQRHPGEDAGGPRLQPTLQPLPPRSGTDNQKNADEIFTAYR